MSPKSAFQPQFGSSVFVTPLGRTTETPALPGTLVRSDGGVLTVTASAPLLPGTAVRMDVDGGMVLGEVVASETGSTRCYLSIKIDQVIPSLSELATLVQRVMEAARSTPAPSNERSERVRVLRATAS